MTIETPPPTITLGQHRHLVTARRVADLLRDSGPLNASEVERHTNMDHEGHVLIDEQGRPLYPRSAVQDALLYLVTRGAIERKPGRNGATLYTFVSDDLVEDPGPKPTHAPEVDRTPVIAAPGEQYVVFSHYDERGIDWKKEPKHYRVQAFNAAGEALVLAPAHLVAGHHLTTIDEVERILRSSGDEQELRDRSWWSVQRIDAAQESLDDVVADSAFAYGTDNIEEPEHYREQHRKRHLYAWPRNVDEERS